MTRKNIFNFIIIYIIGFLSLFCNFDIKIDRNDNTRYIKFAIFNQIYADENNYTYDTTESINIVRKNKKDPDLKESMSNSKSKLVSNLSWIPGVGAMVQSFIYIDQGLKLNSDGIEKAFTGDISSILTGAGMIMDVLAMDNGKSDSVIALDQTFSSNLYCRYQNIYEEETDLVHRSGPAYRGGLEHPIFPIYPLDIKVNDETGLCDLEKSGIIDNNKNFINIGDGGASSQFLRPLITKCSYSYTAASEQCVKELSSPILTAYNIQKTVADAVCIIANLKNGGIAKSVNKIKNAADTIKNTTSAWNTFKNVMSIANNVRKIVGIVSGPIMRAILSFFTDDRFVYDPINLMAILGVEFTFSFLMTALTGIPTDPVTAVAYAICLGTTIGAYAAFTYGVKASVAIIANKHYKKARDAIKNYKFCGYDWFTYTKTPDGKYYKKGINTHSYYKKVYDCINKISDEKGGECGKISSDNICTDNKEFCKTGENQKISKTNKNVKNRLFREYVYGGKEYDAGAIEESILKSGKKFDNRAYLFKDGGYDRFFCIDPRTPEQKGFKSVYQKYYMRGNDKANFACNRFYYDGKSPCILYQNQIYDEDKKDMESLEGGKYYLIPYGNKKLINKYTKQCQEAFIEARKCCQYRSRHLICLENQQTNNNTFCFSNVVEEYSDENSKMTSNIVDLFKNVQNEGDFFKYTCELDGIKFEATKKLGTNHVCVFSYGLCPYDFKLNAGLNYKATYCDANTTDPNLDANNTLKRGSTHFNADDCRKGIFSADIREDYKNLSNEESRKFASFVFDRVSTDMGYNGSECEYNKNDFKTIYNHEKVYDIISNKTINELTTSELRILSEINCDPNDMNDCRTKYNNIFEKGIIAETGTGFAGIAVTKYNLSQYLVNNLKTSAYGQIKNFCQYRAHCVEVEEERLTTEREDNATLFMDSSCTGYTNNSRNLLPGSVVGLPRQLSAPIVECIHESLKNLINGVAGNSLCKEGHAINNEGFCDSDTAESVETAIQNKDDRFFEEKYQTRADDIEKRDVYIVKGQLLPTNYNPFLKLQRNFINVIRAALALFLVIYFYKLFLLGKLGDFTKPENVGKLVFNLFKFSLVIWLIFYNGWQQGVYNRLVNFSSGAFNFVNDLLIKVINNKSNQMLSLKGPEKRLDIEKYDRISETEDEDFKSICYRYDIFNNISYKNVNELTGYCDKGYTRVDKDKIYVDYKENKRYQEKGKLVISTNQEMAKLVSFIDEYNDVNSNKLVLYRISNGQTVSVAADSEPKGEDLYGTNAITYNVDQIAPYDKTNVWSKYYDGCYFDTTEYKEGKSYLALFDTLDCKFIRYLGFSTDRMVPNLIMFSVMMIAPNYLFEGFKADNKGISLIKKVITTVGSVLFGLVMSFVFIMFNVLIKVLYVFLSSFFTLSILIFVSPVVLPLMFYERTKKMVDTWFELIIDTVMKPTFNLCIMIFYINLLDIVLLKNVMFIKHDWRGRGASLNCYSGAASSFVCLVNNLIGGISPNDIKGLFADGLMSFLLDMLMIVMLFVLSDSMLETFDNIVKQIFNFMSNGSGASVMGLFGGNSVAGSEGKSTEEIILGKKTGQQDEQGKDIKEGGAMGAGKSLETFRANYLTKAPGAALDSFINKTTKDGKAKRSFSDVKSGDLEKDANDKTGTKFSKAFGRGVGYMGATVNKVGEGLNAAREFVRKGDERLRASASRITKINAKRVTDNFKAGFSNLNSNIKTLGKNIGSGDKKMEKLRDKIEDNKNKLEKTKKGIEKSKKWLHPLTKYYYDNKKNKLENEIENLEEELIEREENEGKLEYKSLFNNKDQKNLKRKEKSAAEKAQKRIEEEKKRKQEEEKKKEEEEKKKEEDEKEKLTAEEKENEENEQVETEENIQTNTEKDEENETKETKIEKNKQNKKEKPKKK